MDYERFLTIVEHASGFTGESAERAVTAVLRTLAERLSVGEARDLVEELPPQLGPYLFTADPAEGFDVDEFLRRVAERADFDSQTAKVAAQGVFTALARAVGEREFADLVAQLPKDFVLVVPAGPEIVPAQVFVDRVAERAHLDDDNARRVTDAVLESLAERIAAGEVDDLISLLPSRLHEPLRQGKAAGSGEATHMSLDAFLGRVAERSGVTTAEQAFVHARAVLTTLRGAVGKEFFDVSAQLGPQYAALWSPT